MPDEEIVVEIPSEGVTPTPEKEPEVAETREEQQLPAVADLQKQLEEIRAQEAARVSAAEQARRQAEQEAERSRAELQTTKTALNESNVATLDNAIAAAQSEADGYQRQQEAAFAAGDFKLAADFSRKMAKAEARVAQLESGKADIEYRNKIEGEEKAKAKSAPPGAPQSDPFETALANVTPRTAKWMRDQKAAGRDYITDPKLSARATAAHYEALAESYIPDSDAYFDFCERKLGLKEAAKLNGEAKETRRTPAMPSAPVSRDGAPSGGQLSPTQVRLTPGEQRAATDGTITWNATDEKLGAVKGQPIGVKEYARRKMLMEKEGRYDRSYVDQ